MLRLPFLWIYGRKDSTVSVMGANIYPEDIEQALYDEPELAAVTHSFCLSLSEDAHGAVRPCFSFELRGGVAVADELRDRYGERITARTRDSNADFREALQEHAAATMPVIRLFEPGTGPFAADGSRIKQARVIAVDQR